MRYRLSRQFCSFLLAICSIAPIGVAQERNPDFYGLKNKVTENHAPAARPQVSVHYTKEQITLDGNPQEKIWNEVETLSNLWMHLPRDDQAASFKTEIKLCTNDNYLYVLVICHDPNPPVVQSRRRDLNFWSQDGFAIILDPIDKQSNGFIFGTSAGGIPTEGLLLKGGRSTDKNWDVKWMVKTRQKANYWVAEMAIPFRSLRFDAQHRSWGVNFIRVEMSDNSVHSWIPIPRNFSKTDLSFTGKLQWNQQLKQVKNNISLSPYAITQISQDFEDVTSPVYKWNTGLDAKVALNSTLNLDMTINPDFSQVEADEEITNLSRFNIRLPERRQFFLENKDLFEDFSSSRVRPFFSRQIGLDDRRRPIPILYGLRLSGNVNKKLRIGIMNVQTQLEQGQNYLATAFHQRVFNRSTIKGFFVNRQTINTEGIHQTDFGRNAGLEFDYTSQNNKWSAETAYNRSFKAGIQQANAYYKLGARYRSKQVSVFVNWYEVQDNYYADMGFLRNIEHYDARRDTSFRIGYSSLYQSLNFTFLPTTKRNFTAQRFTIINQLQLKATGRDILERKSSFAYQMRFPGDSKIELSISNREVHLLYPFSFTKSTPLPAQTYHNSGMRLKGSSDRRKPLYWNMEGRYQSFYGGTRFKVEGALNYRLQDWGKFGLKLEYNDLHFSAPYGSRKLFSIRPKMNISFSDKLFLNTFIQYNTQSENFNINARLQWRFAPLSDFYFVYSDNYLMDMERFQVDLRWLTLQPKTRSFVMKINYWLSL